MLLCSVISHMSYSNKKLLKAIKEYNGQDIIDLLPGKRINYALKDLCKDVNKHVPKDMLDWKNKSHCKLYVRIQIVKAMH